ncbi:hypothetical protein QOZ80_2BG0187260 [Eleusine coracana subsp. coracana]|nr:hypothetical protein QOZ80_2BG0187260 [Eleusine coracana subsp. coracana]
MDLANGRHDVPNGGVVHAEDEKKKVAKEEEDGPFIASLLTESEAGNGEHNFFHPNHLPQKCQASKEVELADIAKDLNKIKRQNTITHVLLGTVIVMTAVWQVNEMSFLLWVQRKLSNPFKSLGDLIKASLKLKGRKQPVIESSPLPPVGIPDVTRADLPTLVISGDHR